MATNTCASDKKYFFGVKHLILADPETFEPLGIFEVIGGAEVVNEVETLKLEGGNKNGAYALEPGVPASSITATLKEYPNFAFSLFENATITETTGEDSTGFVDTIANKVGTSVFDATAGIASVAAITGSENKLPNGKIVVKATGTDTVNVYLLGDVSKGSIPIVDELPILAEDLTISGTAGTDELSDYGIEFTSGSGAAVFVIGDVAYFETRPTNSKRTVIKVGSNTQIQYFTAILVNPKTSNGDQIIAVFPKVAAPGMSFGSASREFGEYEKVMTPLICDDTDTLYTLETVKVVA